MEHVTVTLDVTYELHDDGLWCIVYQVRPLDTVECGRLLIMGTN